MWLPSWALCERRRWLANSFDSPEGEWLLCTACGAAGTAGCCCHTRCRRCGAGDLVWTAPVAWAVASDAE
jgi:hypothetical protein